MNGVASNGEPTAENTARRGQVLSRVGLRNPPARTMLGLSLLLFSTLFAEFGCRSSAPAPSESPRLHVVAVLYGKYLSAHEGEMPSSQAELVKFIDSNEREILQRRGYKSADEVFTETAGQPRLIVLYRDQRERLYTDFVAIEEQKVHVPDTGGQKIRSKWFAADVLGAAQEIGEDQAKRVLAEAG